MITSGLTRARDLLDRPAPDKIDLAPLLGVWVNFDVVSSGLHRVELTERDGALRVRAFGAASPQLCDWGEVPCRAYADHVATRPAVAFLARYDLGFERVMLVGYLNRWMLTVDASTCFTDGSGRSDYFTRGHFHLS
ncbi:MAG: hypothetical protein ACRDPK_16490 [Carbonactinosporaceae bacterium]